MNKFLTEKGWKAVLQANKCQVKDNGFQRALAAYEKLPEDKYAEQLKALGLVFKLGLALNNTKVKIGNPAVEDYLSKVLEAAVKEQEEVDKALKAAKTSASDKIMLQNMVIEAATTAATNAKTNAAFFGRQVVAACTAFQVYSKSKIDDLDGEMKAADLLGPLIGVVSGGIMGGLMAGVADELGKKIVSEITKVAEGQLNKRAKSIDTASKDLEQAVKALVLGATDTATAMEGVVTRIIIPQFKKVIDGVNSGKRLSDELTAFIEPFIRADTSSIDKVLESRFGLPAAAKSKQIQLKIYKDMVKKFEEKAIIAATPSGEKMKWNITGVPTDVHRKADDRARQAGKSREKDIGAKERQAGL